MSQAILDQHGNPFTAQNQAGDERIRAWSASKTTRLNSAHWANANGHRLNESLWDHQKTLRERCEFELKRNPILAGIVETYITDVVGEFGPQLQLEDVPDRYADAAEREWNEWFSLPDLNGQMSGADMLGLSVRLLFSAGEFLLQFVAERETATGVFTDTKLLSIHPRRLTDTLTNNAVFMGVERDQNGRPLAYWVDDLDERNPWTFMPGNPTRIPAHDMIHGYEIHEPGQARGVPWLGTQLECAAEIRDGDDQIHDAIRAAADFSVVLEADDPNMDYLDVNASWEIERRQHSTLPPGWRATQLKPEQPSTNYVEFRNERLCELGRPINMPLMLIKLDSKAHNYSSARFDNQVYRMGIARKRQWLARVVLNRILAVKTREWELEGKVPRLGHKRKAKPTWVWEPFPHVDPAKEAAAQEKELKQGVVTRTEIAKRRGRDYPSVVKQLGKEREMRIKEGLESDSPAAVQDSTQPAKNPGAANA